MFDFLVAIWAASVFSMLILNITFIVGLLQKDINMETVIEQTILMMKAGAALRPTLLRIITAYPRQMFWASWYIGILTPGLNTFGVYRIFRALTSLSKVK